MVDRSLLGVINVIWLCLSRLLCGSLPRSQTLLSPWFYLWCRKTWLDDVLLLFVKIPVWNLFLPEAKKWFSWGAHHRIVQSYEDRFEVKRHFFQRQISLNLWSTFWTYFSCLHKSHTIKTLASKSHFVLTIYRESLHGRPAHIPTKVQNIWYVNTNDLNRFRY